jgi:hypothetical protein
MDKKDKEEIKSVNEKVLAFGIASLLLIMVGICAFLIFLYYQTAQKVIDKSEKIIEQNETISDLRRALDRTEGRLSVYEDFLIGDRITGIKKMIIRFLRSEKAKSDETTLEQFEEWIATRRNLYRTHDMGGPE